MEAVRWVVGKQHVLGERRGHCKRGCAYCRIAPLTFLMLEALMGYPCPARKKDGRLVLHYPTAALYDYLLVVFIYLVVGEEERVGSAHPLPSPL